MNKSIGPWMHLGMGTAFGYVGYNLNKWEAQLLDLLNEKRVERGKHSICKNKF